MKNIGTMNIYLMDTVFFLDTTVTTGTQLGKKGLTFREGRLV
jgi:hypothetical protein